MIIGKFKTQKDGYSGELVTLTHKGKLVFAPNRGHGVGCQIDNAMRERSRNMKATGCVGRRRG